MTMELAAMHWLRFQKNCPLAFFQRGVRLPFGCVPDVVGITEHRYTVEIEVKRSMSDFRRNANKRHVLNRNHCLDRWPKYFYFLVPCALSGRVQSELPEWSGLMQMGDYGVEVLRPSPCNERAQKLSVKECVRLFRVLGNQVLSSETKAENARAHWREGWEPWGIEYHI